MKFAEHLAAHITPEWRKQYIKYEQMKDMLYEAKEEAPSPEMADADHIQRYFTRFDEEFFQFCDQELLKINTFFSEKLAEASRKIASLRSDLQAAEHVDHHNIALRQRRKTLRKSLLLPKSDHKMELESVESPNQLTTIFSGHEIDMKLRKDSERRDSEKGSRRRLSVRRQTRLYSNYSQRRSSTDSYTSNYNVSASVNAKKMHEIKLAFSEFYLSLILLQNYQTLNFTGFRKILKKHDKLFENEQGSKWRQVHVETAPFYTSKQVDHLIKETESVFTADLEGGNRQKAMKRLRVPPLGEKQNPWTTFRVGLFSGIFLVLLVVTIVAVVFTGNAHVSDWSPALRMYRGLFLIFLIIFLLGINTYGWRSSGVNHVLIFELDPRDHLTYHELFELAGFFGVLLGMNILSYLFSVYIHIPVFANPLFLVAFCILYLINPIRIMQYKARMWLIRVLFRIITAPFHHVGFADFWLADQLNSLSTVIMDLEFLICYYAIEVDWHGENRVEGVCGGISYGIRPLVACLPAWWRFAQCLRRYRESRLVFPHIVNAGKYSTTFLVVLFSSLNTAYTTRHGEEVVQNNAFFYLWIVSMLISTCYTLTWDLKMDWGLLDSNAPPENRFLREEIVYGYNRYYYLAMIEDAILRFSWTLTVSIGESGMLHDEILRTILASLEVFRRFVWNFFRLENEHLNNCGQFRAVRDISIAPIDTNDQALLEKMMDEEDGVSHRTNTERLKERQSRSRLRSEDPLMGDDEDEDNA